MVCGPINFNQKAMGSLWSERQLPGGAGKALEKMFWSRLRETPVSFSGKEDGKMFSDKELQVKVILYLESIVLA